MLEDVLRQLCEADRGRTAVVMLDEDSTVALQRKFQRASLRVEGGEDETSALSSELGIPIPDLSTPHFPQTRKRKAIPLISHRQKENYWREKMSKKEVENLIDSIIRRGGN